jgi:hypothetical protein
VSSFDLIAIRLSSGQQTGNERNPPTNRPTMQTAAEENALLLKREMGKDF